MPTREHPLIGRAGGETPPDLQSGAGRPRRLPDDLLRQASQRLVLACLARAPADRPPSAGTLERRLAEIAVEPWTEEQAKRWWSTHV